MQKLLILKDFYEIMLFWMNFDLKAKNLYCSLLEVLDCKVIFLPLNVHFSMFSAVCHIHLFQLCNISLDFEFYLYF